jgi:hypothetical protein
LGPLRGETRLLCRRRELSLALLLAQGRRREGRLSGRCRALPRPLYAQSLKSSGGAVWGGVRGLQVRCGVDDDSSGEKIAAAGPLGYTAALGRR